MTSRTQARRWTPGVTLIELLVVVSIIGILAAIAYPSYQRYVARTHRNAAAACLSQEAQEMERRYSSTLTYEGGEPNLPCETENGLDRRYNIQLQGNPTRTAYTLRAVPTQLQTAHDACGNFTLTLNQAGARAPTPAQCR